MREAQEDRKHHADDRSEIRDVIQESDQHRPEERELDAEHQHDRVGNPAEKDVQNRLHEEVFPDAFVDPAQKRQGTLPGRLAAHRDDDLLRHRAALGHDEARVENDKEQGDPEILQRQKGRCHPASHIDAVQRGASEIFPGRLVLDSQKPGELGRDRVEIRFVAGQGGCHLREVIDHQHEEKDHRAGEKEQDDRPQRPVGKTPKDRQLPHARRGGQQNVHRDDRGKHRQENRLADPENPADHQCQCQTIGQSSHVDVRVTHAMAAFSRMTCGRVNWMGRRVEANVAPALSVRKLWPAGAIQNRRRAAVRCHITGIPDPLTFQESGAGSWASRSHPYLKSAFSAMRQNTRPCREALSRSSGGAQTFFARDVRPPRAAKG